MLKRMVNALRGSVRLEVSGAFPERFLNLCAQRGIVFWNVEWLEATRLRLTVTRQGSGPARALGDKVLCTVVPAEQSGVPFFLGRFRRRYALLVGLALSLTAVCVLSQFVLTIEVEGNEAVSTAEILTELRREGPRAGGYPPARTGRGAHQQRGPAGPARAGLDVGQPPRHPGGGAGAGGGACARSGR